MTVARTDGAARPTWLVDRWTGPGWRLLERHEVQVGATADRALAALLELPLTEVPLVRLLLRLRGLPFDDAAPLGDFFATAPFIRLEAAPGTEAVFGVLAEGGRPRRLAGPEAFRAAAPAAALAAVVTFRAEPAPGGSRLVTETWAATHGRSASRAFRLYWLAVGRFSAWIRRMILAAARRRAEA